MSETKIIWKNGEPSSVEFDDIYFSKENGLDETRYVFLECNNLPEKWKNKNNFTIAETGFGTGLNFFAAWQMWDNDKNSSDKLQFISIEKHPLSANDIKKATSHWPELSEYVSEFCTKYDPKNNEKQTISLSAGRITLQIYFLDIKNALPNINEPVDTWFLDGFAPAKNPDMWGEHLYKNMDRLSTPYTSFSTFTASGSVRRGLTSNGFTVNKTSGFGKKREMLTGYKSQPQV